MAIHIALLQPTDGSGYLYERIAPPAPGAKAQFRVSLRFNLQNDASSDVVIDRIELGGVKVSGQLDAEETVGIGTRTLLKNNGSVLEYQNVHGWVTNETTDATRSFDDTPVFDEPAPATIELAVFGKGVKTPLGRLAVPLAPGTHAGGALSWPGSVHDLRDNDGWVTSSDHVSGHQAFGLDVVMATYGTRWSTRYPVELETDRRESYRAYGQPVYAMAAGTIGWAVGDHTEWDSPATHEAEKEAGKGFSPTTGRYEAGGNQVFVKTGQQIWVIAHLQRGSIPPELLAEGTPVKRGQYLGKVGYAGDSGEPHFHAHVKTAAAGAPDASQDLGLCDAGWFRPMVFDDAWVTPSGGAFDPWSAKRWTRLDDQSAPDPRSVLCPGTQAPTWNKAWVDKRRYIGVWHPGNHIELRVVRPSFPAFVEAYTFLTDKTSPNKFRLQALETYTENGRQYFIGTFRHGVPGAHFLSLFTNLDAFLKDVEDRHAKGWELLDVCNWVENGSRRFAGVFGAGQNGRSPRLYEGTAQFDTDTDTRAKDNEQLVAVDTFQDKGKPRVWIGIFRKDTQRSNLIHAGTWSAFTDTWSKLGGQRLADLAIGGTTFVGVMRPDLKKTGQALELHTTYGKFTQRCERIAADGWRLARVSVVPD